MTSIKLKEILCISLTSLDCSPGKYWLEMKLHIFSPLIYRHEQNITSEDKYTPLGSITDQSGTNSELVISDELW